MADDMPNKIGLADLLVALRTELASARARLSMSKKAALLDLKEAEVEIQFIVQHEINAGGNVHVGLFAIEAGGKYHKESVHRLTVKLEVHPGADAAVAGSGSGV